MARDIETARALVKNWQRTGELLDQIKWDELRVMTEDDAVRMRDLQERPVDVPLWRAPERKKAEGMVEQQRIFLRARCSRESRMTSAWWTDYLSAFPAGDPTREPLRCRPGCC